MFAEPQASLGEWRNRLQFALQTLAKETSDLDAELANKDLGALAKRRVQRYRNAVDHHRRGLRKLLQPIDVQSQHGSHETYLALRTRLPADQGLNTYYANIHRDWCWGDEENTASLKQIESVLHDSAELGKVLVLGAGAGRLAYDIHQRFECESVTVRGFQSIADAGCEAGQPRQAAEDVRISHRAVVTRRRCRNAQTGGTGSGR